MQWLALCAATCPYLSLSILCSGIVGNGELWSADMLRSEVLCAYFGECYVITVLRDVT
jgi:hypothetical protein